MKVKGLFVSVWTEGGPVKTYAELETDTGAIETRAEDVDDLGSLEREYFEAEDGTEFPVCTTCHEYILKPVMNPDNVGKGLHEALVCSNPKCESNEEQ